MSWGEAMSRELLPDELDLTDSGELVSAMSAAVGRLRQLAAAAFNAGSEEPTEITAAQQGGPMNEQRGPGARVNRASSVARGAFNDSASATYHPS